MTSSRGPGRETAGVLDERSQYCEGLGSQVDRRVSPPQALILEIEPERGGNAALHGRVEHVASARRQRFASEQEINECVLWLLGEKGETKQEIEER